MNRAAVLAALAASCMALPGPAQASARAKVRAAPVESCACLEDLQAAQSARALAATATPDPIDDPALQIGEQPPGASIVRVVTGAGGLITGNPIAWSLVGQVAYLAFGLFSRRKGKPS